MSETYNGWTNYATWRINLEMIDGSEASDYVSGKSRNVTDLAAALSERVEENITSSGSGLAVEYALAFVDYVNWREIAEHMLGDAEPDEDEDEELRTYHALYRFKSMPETDGPLVMRFSADDSDHAREQMENAEPEAQILWISPAGTPEEAIRDFEEHNAP